MFVFKLSTASKIIVKKSHISILKIFYGERGDTDKRMSLPDNFQHWQKNVCVLETANPFVNFCCNKLGRRPNVLSEKNNFELGTTPAN